MGRYTGPKDRLSRREGIDLFGAGAKLTRLLVLPGVHGAKGQRRQPSQYGKQLREKQKVKRLYGVYERQFSNLVEKAMATRGNTADKLFSLLERRLDNVVYRLKLAPSRPAARQLVSHCHVLVNGGKVNIPSYQVKLNDTISLSGKALEIPFIKKIVAEKDLVLPAWLERKAAVGQVKKFPQMSDVTEPDSAQDIIEYYSR
jgi:small subunit ribosomal protein S4